MEKTLDIQLQELREQIAKEIEAIQNRYDPYSNSGIASMNVCKIAASIARGKDK